MTLKEEVLSLSEFLELSPLPYQSLDEEGNIIYVNENWLNMLDYTQDEVLGRWFGDFLEPSYVEHFQRNFPLFKREGEIKDVEFEMLRKDGSVVYTSFNGRVIYDEQGSFRRTHCIAKDITEEKRAKERLKESEENLRKEREFLEQVTETSPVGIVIVDGEGNIVYANSRAEEVLGLSKSNIKQRTYDDLKLRITDSEGEDYPKENLPFELVKKYRAPVYGVEHTIQWPNGKRKLLSINAAPLFDGDGYFDGMIATFEDVTEKVEKERRLEESEDRLQLAMDAADHGFWDWNLDTNETYFSPNYYELLGYQPGELPMEYKTWENLLHPKDKETVVPVVEEAVAKGEPFKIEFRMKTKSGDWKWIQGKGKTYYKDETGAPHRVVGTHEDITQRKKSEEVLWKSERFLQDVFNCIQDGISVLDTDLNIRRVNWAMEQWYAENMPLVGKKCYSAYHNHNTICEGCPSVLAIRSGKTERDVVPGLHGSPIEWLELFSYPMYDTSGTVTGVVEFVRDITKRKQAEEMQRTLIHELRTINDTIVKASRIEDIDEMCLLVGMSVHNLNPDSFVVVSYYDWDIGAIKIQEIIGLGEKVEEVFDLLGDPKGMHIHPENMGEEARLFTTGKLERVNGIYDLLAGEIPQDTCRQVEDILGIRSVHTVGFALGDEPGVGISILSREQDIRHKSAVETLASHFSVLVQRRQADKRIRKSEELYYTLVENVNDMVFMLNSQGEVTFFNSYAKEHYSLSEEEVISLGGTHISFFWCDESIDEVQEAVNKVIEQKEEQSLESICEDRHYLLKITPLLDSGELTGMIAVARDFTNYKKAMEELRERERTLEDIVEGSQVPAFVLDRNHKVLHWNNACEKISGVNAEEVVGTNKHWYPWYLEERPVMADLIIGGSEDDLVRYYGDKQLTPSIKEGAYEAIDFFPHLGEDGKWLYFTASPLKDEKGRVTGAIETLQDITERKRAEEKLKAANQQLIASEQSLRESEEKYSILADNMEIGLILHDQETKIIYSNQKAGEILGLTQKQMAGKKAIDPAWKFIREDGSPLPLAEYPVNKAIESKKSIKDYQIGVYIPGRKSPKWVSVNAVPVLDKNGIISYVSITFIDITERKIAEESLKASEAKFKSYIQNAPDGIFIANENGGYIEVNKAACEITGYSEDELLKLTIPELIQEEYSEKAKNHFQTLVKDGFARDELGFVTKSGEKRFWSVDAVKLSETRFLGFAKEITERKEKEKQVRESLEEKKTLLREVHHRVKNNLQVVSGLLYLQSDKVGQGASEALLDSMNRVKSMALVHEELYQSDSLARVDFNDYVNRQLAHLLDSYSAGGIALNTKIQDVYLNINVAVPVGLIITELVSNSLKHAFPDNQGEITVSMYQDDKIKLIVSDDGVGFPDVDFTKSDSLGMQLVNRLVKQVDGTIELHKDEGTTWEITFEGGRG